MLPHVSDRPLSLQRFPEGIERQGFFQQEASDHLPDWVRRAKVPRRGGGTVEHPVCDDARTLAYLANLAVVRLHTWTSRVADPSSPSGRATAAERRLRGGRHAGPGRARRWRPRSTGAS
jgi:bifunctional non-homologous end joining protein LigD